MKQIVFISEECHGTIGAAADFQKAKQFLIDTGWIDELWFIYEHGEDVGRALIEVYGDKWQEAVLAADEDFFDGSFYFSKKLFLE